MEKSMEFLCDDGTKQLITKDILLNIKSLNIFQTYEGEDDDGDNGKCVIKYLGHEKMDSIVEMEFLFKEIEEQKSTYDIFCVGHQTEKLRAVGLSEYLLIRKTLENSIIHDITDKLLSRSFELGDVSHEKFSKLYERNLNIKIDSVDVEKFNLSEIEKEYLIEREYLKKLSVICAWLGTQTIYGDHDTIVVNSQLLSIIQNFKSFNSFDLNDLVDDKSLHKVGTLEKFDVYFDPKMEWVDTRTCVLRSYQKSREKFGGYPIEGLVFYPIELISKIELSYVKYKKCEKVSTDSLFNIEDVGDAENAYFTFRTEME